MKGAVHSNESYVLLLRIVLKILVEIIWALFLAHSVGTLNELIHTRFRSFSVGQKIHHILRNPTLYYSFHKNLLLLLAWFKQTRSSKSHVISFRSIFYFPIWTTSVWFISSGSISQYHERIAVLPMRVTCPAYLILPDWNTSIIFREK